jgi:hypothetical protein
MVCFICTLNIKNKTMKKVLVVTILLMFGFSFQVFAANDNQSQGNDKSNTEKDNKAIIKTVATQDKGSATKTEETSKTKSQKGQFNAELHRSVVDAFVQGLLTVAEREGGIGQEVQVIAKQQNDIRNRASDLINAVENRNKVKTFFIGTSYKNLGELRSQMVQTRNQIDQLKRLAEKAENEGDKTELQTQIQTLEQEQTKINDFITQNESKFSLFGWAVKLFRK